MKKMILAAACFCMLLAVNAQTKTASSSAVKKSIAKPERLVEITTTYGVIVVKLYDSTPLHRDNFLRLVKGKFYDSLLFHRVIDGFMIQGGDPTSKNAPLDTVQLGNGEVPGVDRIPAEFKTFLYHKRGALAMARDDNPEKASSNCQFYIVQGKQFNDVQLNGVECQIRSSNPAFTYTDAQRKMYKTVGGAPFLDQNYTVFGEVVKGIEVVDKIAKVPRDGNDRPLQNVVMKMRLLN